MLKLSKRKNELISLHIDDDKLLEKHKIYKN